jgi:hypothetical protein
MRWKNVYNNYGSFLLNLTDYVIFRAYGHKMAENALRHMLLKPITARVIFFSRPYYATLRARLRAIWTTPEKLNFLLQRVLTVCRGSINEAHGSQSIYKYFVPWMSPCW